MSDTIAVSFAGLMSKPLVIQQLKPFYPDITHAIAVFIAKGENEPKPGFKRWRSRGQHQPGSSKYACTFVYALPGGISGWYYNSCLYIYTGTLSGYLDKDHYYSFSKSASQLHDSMSYHLQGRTYAYEEFWTESGWSGRYRGYARYSQWMFNSLKSIDLEAAIALTECRQKDVTRTSNGRYTLPEVNSTPEPEAEERHMAEQIDNDAVPNLVVYLNDAYIDAYNHLPQITSNNIQNLLQVYGILKKLVMSLGTGNVSGLTEIGSLSDAWMGYRYAYSTTKMDIEELASYVDRSRNIAKASSIFCRGSASWSNNNGSYLLRCSMTVPTQENSEVLDILEKLGLALDGYNAWDLVPYSFVVDWFLHIGDFLETARSRRYAERVRPSTIWFSITHEYTNAHGQHQCDYYRWLADSSYYTRLATLPSSMLTHQSAKGSTWVKRGVDAVCLLT